MVGQRAFDGLLDPPGGIRGQLCTLFRIEPFDPFHEADVTFIDEVEQRQAEILIIARDLYHEPQVGFDHTLARFLIAAFDSFRERYFLVRRQQFNFADFAQVKLKGIGALS